MSTHRFVAGLAVTAAALASPGVEAKTAPRSSPPTTRSSEIRRRGYTLALPADL
jgi:hypothetical protein